MNGNILPAAVIAWLKNQGAQLLQAGKSAGKVLAALEPGGVYEARVLQRLPQGRYLVQVGEQPLNMALPGQHKPGEALKLVYLRAEPRPTFMLVQPETGAGARSVQVGEAASRLASLARWAGPPPLPAAQVSTATAPANASPGALPTGLQPAAAQGAGVASPAASAQASPSAMPTQAVPVAARLLSLPEAGQAARAAMARSQPLLEQPAAQGQAWLAPLRQAVQESGLFYEANLGRWVRGEQGLEAIQRQPQARFADPVLLAQSPRVAELDGMPEEVARLAGRQLNMLEGQPFLWQGFAWPGQPLDWLIQEREGDGSGDGEAPQWQTELRLTLPNLGGVAAEIVLAPRGLRLRLAAENVATEARLREALPELANRLDAAGLTVLGLMVVAGHVPPQTDHHGQEAAA